MTDYDAYDRSLGIPSLLGASTDGVTEEAMKLLDLPPKLLRAKSAAECGEAAFILSQFAFRLQRAINIEQRKVNEVEEKLRRMRRSNDHETIRLAEEARFVAKQKLVGLTYLPLKVQDMIKTLMSIQNTKRGEQN